MAVAAAWLAVAAAWVAAAWAAAAWVAAAWVAAAVAWERRCWATTGPGGEVGAVAPSLALTRVARRLALMPPA